MDRVEVRVLHTYSTLHYGVNHPEDRDAYLNGMELPAGAGIEV